MLVQQLLQLLLQGAAPCPTHSGPPPRALALAHVIILVEGRM